MTSYCVGAALPLSTDRWSVLDWGGECVVFDASTGSCHLLSEYAGAIFTALLGSDSNGMDARELCAQVFGFAPGREWPEGAQAVENLLSGLRDAGLIQEARA